MPWVQSIIGVILRAIYTVWGLELRVTNHNKAHIEGGISLYVRYSPTVHEWGRYPNLPDFLEVQGKYNT